MSSQPSSESCVILPVFKDADSILLEVAYISLYVNLVTWQVYHFDASGISSAHPHLIPTDKCPELQPCVGSCLGAGWNSPEGRVT